MTRLEHSIEIEAPIERVYEFWLDPDIHTNFFPSNIQVQKHFNGKPRVGDTYDFSGELAGQGMKLTFKYIELEPNVKVVEERVKGDMKRFRDSIVLEKIDHGTRVTDTWEYELPYSVIGKVIDAVKARKELRNYLTEILRKAKESLEK